MTLTASNTNELLYDNNTVKTHHDNRSDFLTKTGLEAFFLGKFTLFLSDIEKATFPLFSWFFTLVLLFLKQNVAVL